MVLHEAKDADVVVVWVPGSFEIPLAARELAENARVEAVVCLGVLIRGDTPHFDVIAAAAAQGISAAGTSTGVPTTFGVITCDTLEQAMDRAGGQHGNKGAGAALAGELSDTGRPFLERVATQLGGELAAVTAAPLSTVKARLYRGMDALREVLERGQA